MSRYRFRSKIPAPVRFWAKVDKNGPIPQSRPDLGRCWLWTAAIAPNGYGLFHAERMMQAHRFSYREEYGSIDGEEVDHLCRVRSCIRPTHLEAVTHVENVKRGTRANQTHCHRGHELFGENLYQPPNGGGRTCRACTRIHKANYRARLRADVSNDVSNGPGE